MKAKVPLGFSARHLGFPWLSPAGKAKESQAKPMKAKLREGARIGRRKKPAAARRMPAFARECLQEPTFADAGEGEGRSARPVPRGRMLTDVYVC